MSGDGSLWIVIPAYNESAVIGSVIAQLRAAHCTHICIVDDGSSDDTGTLAREAGAHVLRHVVNLGQGAALQTGIDYALAQGAGLICTFDADGQHAPESIAAMMAALERSGADLALGSRFAGTAVDMPLGRRLLLRAAVFFTRAHAGVRVSDTHNGLRLFTRRAAQAIHIEQAGMAHASEILRCIGKTGMRFVEVPTTVYYTAYSRRKGQSGFEAVKIILDLLYRSMVSRQ